jgi:hypothetical protein
VNIDVKPLKKILANQIQQSVRKITYHDWLFLFHRSRMIQHRQINKHNAARKQNQGQKLHDHLNRCRKSLWKNLTSFMIKSLNKLGEEMCLNIIKAIYKPITNIVPNGKS